MGAINQDNPVNLTTRVANVSSLFIFLILLVFIAYYVMKYFPVFQPVWRCIGKVRKHCCTKKSTVAPEGKGVDLSKGEGNPRFEAAAEGVNHSQMRALESGMIVRPEVLYTKPKPSCDPVDMLFGCWGLRVKVPKVTQ